MHKRYKKLHNIAQKGFTLIELLIVIAIIALLSSVVLVSTNSARVKAKNSKVIQQVREYQKAFAQYYNQYGYYPASGAAIGTRVCLGNGYNYNGVAGTCVFRGSKNESATLTTALSAYMPSQPAVSTDVILWNGFSFQGASYTCGAVDGSGCAVNSGTQIQWILEGSVACGPTKNAPSVSAEGNTYCYSDPAGQD